MIRFFGSDVLHTWVLGFVEAAVGFTLQIVKYIGHANVDPEYSQSPKKLIEIVREFPSHNSLQPTKKHVRFSDIFELVQAPSSKKTFNPKNTTSILKMRESGKLPPALFQIFFALADEDILPGEFNWSRGKGFSEPHFSPRQVVIHAINAVLEVHWHLKCGSLTERQLCTLQMLISNAQAHMLVLDVMRKRIIHKAITAKSEYLDPPVEKIGLMNNVKFELITHMVEAMRQSGCDNNVRDTEQGEMLMKLCKVLFTDTNMRYHTVLKDMLKKYLHLEYMSLARKGLDHFNHCSTIGKDSSRSHNSDFVVTATEEKEFKTNNAYKQQCVEWCAQHGMYKTKKDGANWNVHPLLKLVR